MRWLKRLRELSSQDPQIDDPVAKATKWTPLAQGAQTHRTRKLVQTNPHRMEFKATFFSIVFIAFVATFCLTFVIGFAYVFLFILFLVEKRLPVPSWFHILCGMFVLAIYGALYYFGTKPIVFDKQEGYFWKGRGKPPFDEKTVKSAVPLERIYALQLLVSGGSEFQTYELNLVLKDGNRVGVVCHGNVGALQADAKTLADFFGVLVWDAR